MQSNKKHIDRLINPEVMELILYPTEQCNFRCTYCYENFDIGKMSESVQLSVKKLISELSKK